MQSLPKNGGFRILQNIGARAGPQCSKNSILIVKNSIYQTFDLFTKSRHQGDKFQPAKYLHAEVDDGNVDGKSLEPFACLFKIIKNRLDLKFPFRVQQSG